MSTKCLLWFNFPPLTSQTSYCCVSYTRMLLRTRKPFFFSSLCSVHHLLSHFTVSTPQRSDILSYQQQRVLFGTEIGKLVCHTEGFGLWGPVRPRPLTSVSLINPGTSPTYPSEGGTIPSTMTGTCPTRCSMSSPTPMEEAGRRLVHVCVRRH